MEMSLFNNMLEAIRSHRVARSVTRRVRRPPHHGEQERARRLRQIDKGMIQVSPADLYQGKPVKEIETW